MRGLFWWGWLAAALPARLSLEKIPAPEFIVLYNGTKPYPDQTTLKLSDAFKDAADLRGAAPSPSVLELEVKVYNINKGHNADIVAKCEKLQGYSFFVDKVREMGRDLPREDAMKAAIDYCIKHDVLQDFLERNSSEVFNMLLTEWDTEEAKEVWFEEGIEVGIKRGREEGWLAMAQLLQEGKTLDEAITYLKGPTSGV